MQTRIIKTIISNGREFEIGHDITFLLRQKNTAKRCSGIINEIHENGFEITNAKVNEVNIPLDLFIRYSDVVDGELNIIGCIWGNEVNLNTNTKVTHICPYCGKSYYQELYSVTTGLYFPPIYKDGVNINPDRNVSSTTCLCLNCGQKFMY